MTAHVVPIPREDYYYGIYADEENNVVASNKLDKNYENVPEAISTTSKNDQKKKFGSKLLRDRNNNLVNIYSGLNMYPLY